MSFRIVVLLLLFLNLSQAQTPQVASGALIEYPDFTSHYIGKRMVRVWLPENYSPQQKYQVLYAHDGQMLWDASLNWNRQEWQLDEVLSELIRKRKVKPTIVVAIDNAGSNRHSEYFPQEPFESLTGAQQESLYGAERSPGQKLFGKAIYSDRYLKFLTEELKPFIDRSYPTLSDRKHNFVMGSSMGGLVSMYAATEYPDVFGGAICMSTHWPGTFTIDNNPVPQAFQDYLKNHLSTRGSTKYYFDYGTATLDALYEPLQQQVDRIFPAKKYRRKNWQTLKFSGADHSESAWAKRLAIPLSFMLK